MFIEIEKNSYDVKCLKRNLTIQSCPLPLMWTFMDMDIHFNKDRIGNYVVSPYDGTAVFMDFFFDTYSETINIHFTPNISHPLKLTLLNSWLKKNLCTIKKINKHSILGRNEKIA